MSPLSVDRRDVFWLRLSLAFIWLATGLGVLFPSYRTLGDRYLGLMHLPDRLMGVTCLFEVLLGLRLLLAPAGTVLALVQAAMIVFFTVVLGLVEPELLWHPYGMLTKNVPLLALVGTVWLVEREGWTSRALWLLRGGMASIWLLEGVLPCLLFQEEPMRQLLTRSGLALIDPGLQLRIIGVLQILSAVAVLVLSGWPLRALLVGHILGLAAISGVVGWYHPEMLTHPFGPVTKNVSILIGTVVVLRRVGGRFSPPLAGMGHLPLPSPLAGEGPSHSPSPLAGEGE